MTSYRFFTAMSPKVRLRLLLLTAVSLFTLAVRFAWLKPDMAVGSVRYLGYWAVAAIVATGIYVGYRAFRNWRFSVPVHAAPLAVTIVCALFLQLHEPHRLRVMYDEYVLLETSREMHLERQAFVAAAAGYKNGNIVMMHGFVDKRPLLFSFLLSLVHDSSGYRIANVYVLNGLISFALFWLVFWLGEAIGGRRFGYLGMLLVAGIPLVANVATSGAYDLLNMTLIVAFLLAARRYGEEPSAENQNLLVMTGVLLAQARYESMLFLIPLAVVVAWTWWRNRKVQITRLSVMAPAMILLPLLCNLVYLSNDGFFESKMLGVPFFDASNLAPNLERMVYYFFNFSRDLTNSPVVSYAGSAALLLLLVGVRSTFRRGNVYPSILIIVFASLFVILGNTGMMLANFWGQFDDPMASRFSLPLQLMLVVAILVALAQFRQREHAATVGLLLAGVSIWIWSIPTTSRHFATSRLFSANETEWMVGEVLERFDHRTLVLGNSALPLMTRNLPAVPFAVFNAYSEGFWSLIEKGYYDQIVVFQTLQIDPETKQAKDASPYPITSRAVLEPMFETRFRVDYISRCSRLVGVRANEPEAKLAGEDAQSAKPPSQDP
jgi:hypothetical protein